MNTIAPIAADQPGTHAKLADLDAKIIHQRGKITSLSPYQQNKPEISRDWQAFISAVRQRNNLSSDLRELIILRIAVLNHSPHEFASHVAHAQKAGLSNEKIHAVKAFSISPIFTQREQLVLALADGMTQHIDMPEPLFEQIAWLYAGKELLDLCMIVGAYNMVSRALIALPIET